MVSLLCCAAALLCWTTTPAARRLRELTGDHRRRRIRPPRPSSMSLAAAATTAGWLVAGPGGAIAAVLATVTAWRRWRARGDLHRSLSAIGGLAEAIHSLVAGLRAGAHPADAAEAAAVDAHPAAAASMRAIAAAARLDGDIRLALAAAQSSCATPRSASGPGDVQPNDTRTTADRRLARPDGISPTPPNTRSTVGGHRATARPDSRTRPTRADASVRNHPQPTATRAQTHATPAHAFAAALARVSRAWALAHRHGLPLADLLDSAGRDLEQRVRFARQVLARMAGPRTSATVLALLPALGVALGEAIGAHPLHMLTGPGHLLLAFGVALLCAGVAWCGRLTGQVVP